MKRLALYSTITLLLIFQSCTFFNLRKVEGDGDIISKVYEIKDYSTISANGIFNIIYQQKKGAPYLKVETDSNMLDYIDIDSDGSDLNIELDDSAKPSVFKIYTNSPELLKAKLSGAGSLNLKDSVFSENLLLICSGANKITIEKLDASSLTIKGSGASSVIIEELVAQKLTVEGSGSTKVEAEGRVKDAKFAISGSGKIEALNLQTQKTKCKISGSGKVTINCEEELDVSISGSGNIKYSGNAQVSQDVSGSGKVEKI